MSEASWETPRMNPEISTGKTAPQFGDYYELLKPRVMRLVVFTAFIGLITAPVPVNPILGAVAILCIAIGAGASGALNMWVDYDVDAIMGRTRSRPIPSGRVPREHVLIFGLTLSAFAVSFLFLFGNALAAALLAFTIFFYVVIYSLGLKRRTPQNIVIGGAAGAFPPLIGWVVATGSIALEPVLMFLLIFIWTPPHFWALALFRNDDYTRAEIPMMPVTKGEKHTRFLILVYASLLVPVALSLAFTSVGGPVYLFTTVVLNALFVFGAIRLWRRHEAQAVQDNYRPEKRFFAVSIAYLFLHFLALLADYGLKAFWAIDGTSINLFNNLWG